MEIWHNPRCSKSRAARTALLDAGREFKERLYLEDVPTVAELDDVLTRLGLEPWDIARTGDPLAKEIGLAGTERDRGTWLDILATHPSLIQRPIILTDDGRAYVARDPDTVGEALS
jgi:arsenate reductase